MAVHLPLSIEAQIEARVLMMSTNNILTRSACVCPRWPLKTASPTSSLSSRTPTSSSALTPAPAPNQREAWYINRGGLRMRAAGQLVYELPSMGGDVVVSLDGTPIDPSQHPGAVAFIDLHHRETSASAVVEQARARGVFGFTAQHHGAGVDGLIGQLAVNTGSQSFSDDERESADLGDAIAWAYRLPKLRDNNRVVVVMNPPLRHHGERRLPRGRPLQHLSPHVSAAGGREVVAGEVR
jgi:DNA-directed RNA polymerase beta' subunit